MGLHRYSAKRDGNESEIKDALRTAGCTVVELSVEGVCDLLVGLNGINYLIEVKNGKNDLTDAQIKFFEEWEGQCAVVRTIDEALQVIGRISK